MIRQYLKGDKQTGRNQAIREKFEKLRPAYGFKEAESILAEKYGLSTFTIHQIAYAQGAYRVDTSKDAVI